MNFKYIGPYWYEKHSHLMAIKFAPFFYQVRNKLMRKINISRRNPGIVSLYLKLPTLQK